MSDEFAYACRLLARREYSEGELRRKLKTRWPESDRLEETIRLLLDEGMLCDSRFAEAFVRSRVARLQGPRKIRAELSRRDVSETIVTQSLEESAIDWRDLARQWLGRQPEISNDYEMRAKYYRRLLNRGFTHDQAMDALNTR